MVRGVGRLPEPAPKPGQIRDAGANPTPGLRCAGYGRHDLRDLPLSMRKVNIARLLARRPDGIFMSEFEQGEIGPDLFRKACESGLEGLVSKHRDGAYRG
jgi:hypothetical protein